MIGRSCKRCEALRRAVLIGRALHRLDQAIRNGSERAMQPPGCASDKRIESLAGTAPCERDHREGDHPTPFRTRQLSPSSPKVLRWSPWEDRASCSQGAFPCPRPACAPQPPAAPPSLSGGCSSMAFRLATANEARRSANSSSSPDRFLTANTIANLWFAFLR